MLHGANSVPMALIFCPLFKYIIRFISSPNTLVSSCSGYLYFTLWLVGKCKTLYVEYLYRAICLWMFQLQFEWGFILFTNSIVSIMYDSKFFYIIIVVAICPQVAFCFGLGPLGQLLFCILLEDILQTFYGFWVAYRILMFVSRISFYTLLVS